MTINELKKWGIAQLKRLTELPPPSRVLPETVRIEVSLFLQETFGLTQEQLILHGDREITKEITPEQTEKFKSFIQRRMQSEPVAYILGKKDFYNHTFVVDSSVLIPRPETELLVELALKYFDENTRNFYIADICTGSGVIILSIVDELRRKFGEQYLSYGEFHAVDISDNALNIARKNASTMNLAQQVKFYKSDLCSEISVAGDRTLILFIANPPYIMEGAPLPADVEMFEPRIALKAGEDGLSIIRRLLHELTAKLKLGAKLIMEIGEEQEAGVREILCTEISCAGIEDSFKFVRDYSGKVRVVWII